MYLEKIDDLPGLRPATHNNTMSWSQRFMEKKGETETTASAGAGGGGEWKTVGQRAAAGGGGGGSWRPKPKADTAKPALNMSSEEQFPSLVSKPRPTAEQARLQGFSALAASWASQDAAEAAEQKRLRNEAQVEADKRAKEAAQYGILDSIMRRRVENSYGGGGSNGCVTRAYGDAEGAGSGRCSPHSPTYPPYDEEAEAEEEEERPRGGNPMFAYDEDEEGWATR